MKLTDMTVEQLDGTRAYMANMVAAGHAAPEVVAGIDAERVRRDPNAVVEPLTVTDRYAVAEIVRLGGKRWTREDKDRVYVTDAVWHDLIGLDVKVRRTGSVADAVLAGERLSNTLGTELLNTRVYLDVASGKIIVVEGSHRREVGAMVREAIRERLGH